jgi:hypothetical protein
MTNQEEMFVKEHNVMTGEITSRLATEEEKNNYLLIQNEILQDQLNKAREQEALEKEKEAIFTKLGLTREQFDLLMK